VGEGLPTVCYASAGGVVTEGERVLVLVRPGRLRPDGRAEVRLPKGHIESGESREETARREVGEEAGLWQVEIVADLGHQTVEFDWQDRHVIRDESFFLMTLPAGVQTDQAEKQFTPTWLAWEEALAQLTFEAEQEWVRRAYITIQEISSRASDVLQNVTDQYAQQPDDHTQVQQQIPVGEQE
jgi:8-oxo-dGTP pyrophosphatase MutT (NUDIX family)